MAEILSMPVPQGSFRFGVDVFRLPDGTAAARIMHPTRDVVEEDPQEPHLKLAKLADELGAAAEALRTAAANLDPDTGSGSGAGLQPAEGADAD